MGNGPPASLAGESVSGVVAPSTANKSSSPREEDAPSASGRALQPAEKLLGRRKLTWTAVSAFLTASVLMFMRFFFPRTLFEPASRFPIGSVADFGLGVDERFKQSRRIWVVRQP